MPRRSVQDMLLSVFTFHRKSQHREEPVGSCFYCNLEVEYNLWNKPKNLKAKRSTKNKGGGQADWAKVMRKMPCHYCGGAGGTIDHKIPRSQGGPTTKANCVPACEPCNNFRGCSPYEEFRGVGWKKRPFSGTKMALGLVKV